MAGRISTGCARTPASSFSRALASGSGSPRMRAPSASAPYSREREIAIWISSAAIGARKSATSPPAMSAMPPPSSSSLPKPPKIMLHITMSANMLMAPATLAAMLLISVSRCLMCASSWAMTPASSWRLSVCMMPVVTATAPLLGERPVAKALGMGLSITYSAGLGIPARPASVWTMRCNSGISSGATLRARLNLSASLSENHQAPMFMAIARNRANTMPVVPPMAAPISRNSPVRAPRKNVVLTVFQNCCMDTDSC